MRTAVIVFAAIMLLSLGAMQSRAARAEEQQDLALDSSTVTPTQTVVLKHGQRIEGKFDCYAFTVPIGVTAYVDEDLEIQAASDIVVAGRLIARDRTMDDSKLDGIKINLIAESAIYIPGTVQGGRGRDAAPRPFQKKDIGMPGGNGSDIQLRALINIVDGLVVGGGGGTSAPRKKGPRGGDVHVYGYNWTSRDDSIGVVGGGAGYNGKMPGGPDWGADGADGGSAICHGPEPKNDNPKQELLAQRIFYYHVDFTRLAHLPTSLSEEEVSWRGQGRGHPATAPFPAANALAGCPDIIPGRAPTGGHATGDPGMDSTGMGANGDVNHNDGYEGPQGGTGGAGVATMGCNGLKGNDCCPPAYDPPCNPGGKGQDGGHGGIGTGGVGGKGGSGGNGIVNGDGGKGGKGGIGGTGTSSDAGQGGKGGAQFGPAGSGGTGYPGRPGAGGPGGPGGEGAGMGSDGGTGGMGPPGGKMEGMDGNTNDTGGGCPTPPMGSTH